jgi:hypothetical protein
LHYFGHALRAAADAMGSWNQQALSAQDKMSKDLTNAVARNWQQAEHAPVPSICTADNDVGSDCENEEARKGEIQWLEYQRNDLAVSFLEELLAAQPAKLSAFLFVAMAACLKPGLASIQLRWINWLSMINWLSSSPR